MAIKVGVALIGSGIFVKEEHLPAVQACAELELKAIYSRSLRSAKALSEQLDGISLYSDDSDDGADYSALLARSDIHAVIIALPIPVQPSFIRKALSAGKHVLAEKPLAPDVKAGVELLNYYRNNIDTAKINFSIAEQLRYLPEYILGAEHARRLGRVLGCRVCLQTCVPKDSKYYQTAWRQTPQYQGGFLLDGGVHTIAVLRKLLGAEARISSLSANTAQLQDYLPPVDTLDATLKLANGGTGTLTISFGTTLRARQCSFACQEGVVNVERDKVVLVSLDGKETVEEARSEKGGVALEVEAWAASLVKGEWDPLQYPEEALADLEVLEACLKSGEQGGQPIALKWQDVNKL